MKTLLFVVCFAVYSNIAIAERYFLIFPDGEKVRTDVTPRDLTYPPPGVKLEVQKIGERNEGTPMSSDEVLARNQTAHLIIGEVEIQPAGPRLLSLASHAENVADAKQQAALLRGLAAYSKAYSDTWNSGAASRAAIGSQPSMSNSMKSWDESRRDRKIDNMADTIDTMARRARIGY